MSILNIKNITRVIYISLSISCFSFASIDSGLKNDWKTSNNNIKSMTFKSESINKLSNHSNINFTPLYMNRSFEIITSNTYLSNQLLKSTQQVQLNYEKNGNLISHTQFIINNNSQLKNYYTFHFSKNFNFTPFSFETYMQSKTEESDYSSNNSYVIGAKGATNFKNLEVNGEISYLDHEEDSSLKASFQGKYPIPSLHSQFSLAWDFADSQVNSFKYLNSNYTKGLIYSPDFSNISVLNASLACVPRKNMFMSLDYYYYHQDINIIQSYAYNDYSSFDAYTTGESKHLGQEVDVKAIYAHSNNLKSGFFAGWFNPGEAYSNKDDTKTFEIRGEIVVNF